MVEAGHQVQMVCLRHDLTHTGLSDPFINRRRSGLVDGIEVVESTSHTQTMLVCLNVHSFFFATAGTA